MPKVLTGTSKSIFAQYTQVPNLINSDFATLGPEGLVNNFFNESIHEVGSNEYIKNKEYILGEATRFNLVSAKNSYTDFINKFESSGVFSHDYTQGNIDGGLPELINTVLIDPKPFGSFPSNKILRFNYSNENNEICSLGLIVDEQNPQTWMLELSSNVLYPGTTKLTTLIAQGAFFYQENIPGESRDYDFENLIERHIKSKEIATLLKPIMSNGVVSLDEIEKLNLRLHNEENIDYRDSRTVSLNRILADWVEKPQPNPINSLREKLENDINFFVDENFSKVLSDLTATAQKQSSNKEQNPALGLLYEQRYRLKLHMNKSEENSQKLTVLKEKPSLFDNIYAESEVDYVKSLENKIFEADYNESISKLEARLNQETNKNRGLGKNVILESLKDILKLSKEDPHDTDKKYLIDSADYMLTISTPDQRDSPTKLIDGSQKYSDILNKLYLGLRMERCSAAIKEFEKAIKQNPHVGSAQNNQLLFAANQIKTIIQDILSQPNFEAMQNLENMIKVLNDCQKVIEFTPGSKQYEDSLVALEPLTQVFSTQPSPLLSQLGKALFAFTSIALIALGVAGLIPTGGISLVFLIAGTSLLFGISGGLYHKGEQQKLKRSSDDIRRKWMDSERDINKLEDPQDTGVSSRPGCN